MITGPGFVFVDLPKCGTTSVRKALHEADVVDPHCATWDWHRREIPAAVEHLPRFAIVRNPYTRALSLWHFERYQVRQRGKRDRFDTPLEYWQHWQLERLEGFLEALIENRGRSAYWLYLPCALFLAPCEPVTVLALEQLQRQWDHQPELPALTIPHERRQAYHETLTPTQCRLIEQWAREDFERYGYALRDA